MIYICVIIHSTFIVLHWIVLISLQNTLSAQLDISKHKVVDEIPLEINEDDPTKENAAKIMPEASSAAAAAAAEDAQAKS